MKRIHVLLSGGSGSRLWPLSRKSMTKQYIPIFEGRSLFEKAISLNSVVCDEGIVVVDSASYDNTLGILDSNFKSKYSCIIERKPKNTAAAIAFAALKANQDDILLVTPSDHIIENEDLYYKAVNQAFKFASRDNLVTFGIKPTRPETGYGYIQSNGNDVIAFHEKPCHERAKSFLSANNYYWNSGIFAFKAGVYLDELKKFRNDIYTACMQVIKASNGEYLDEDLTYAIPSESIDFAVMEKSDKIKVVPGCFEWSDLGSFESLYDYFKTKSVYVSGTNLIIAQDHVELHGLENVFVIQNKGALLIMPIFLSQEVKQIYERLLHEGSKLIE